MSRAPAATPPPMPPFAALESPVEVTEAVDNVADGCEDVREVTVLVEPVVIDVLSGIAVPSQSKVPLIDT
jgi:hypothetical protein